MINCPHCNGEIAGAKFLKTALAKKRGAESRVAKQERNRMICEMALTMPRGEIAAHFDLCYLTICKIIKKAGVEAMRKPGSGGVQRNDVDQMAEMYLGGKKLQEIGDQFGISRERVRQLLRSHGVESLGHRVEYRRKPDPLTSEQIDAIEMYTAGARPMDIAAKYPNVGLDAALRKAGVKRFGTAHFLKKHDEKAVAEAYLRGDCPQQIMKQFGFANAETIYRHLKRAGVKPNRKLKTGETK